MKFSYLILLSFLGFPIFAFQNVQVNETAEILDTFLKFYIAKNEVESEKDTLFLLNKNTFSLQKSFIPQINQKMSKYKLFSKNCESKLNQITDTLAINDCLNKRKYEIYNNLITLEDSKYLNKFVSQKQQMTYDLKNLNKKIILLDSLSFAKKQILNFRSNNYKIEFRGPFYTQNRKTALLEVYKHSFDGGVLFLVFKKENENWKMMGNVKF